jgi:hypothetical protein
VFFTDATAGDAVRFYTNATAFFKPITVSASMTFSNVADTLTVPGRVLGAHYGCLFHTSGAGTTQTVGSTYQRVSNYTACATTTGLTYDTTAGTFTINKAGVYDVFFQHSFVGDNSEQYEVALHTNGVEYGQVEFIRTMGSAAAIGSASAAGLFSAASNTVIDVRCKNAAGGTFNVINSQFKIKEVR